MRSLSFRVPTLNGSSKRLGRSIAARGCQVGVSLSPCCSANWAAPTCCARSRVVSRVAKANWRIWAFKPRHARRCPTPTVIGPGSCSRRYSTDCSRSLLPRRSARRSSGSRTSWSTWTRPSSTCACRCMTERSSASQRGPSNRDYRSAQAKPQDQNPRRHLGQRVQDPDSDGTDLDAAALPTTVVPLRLEPH